MSPHSTDVVDDPHATAAQLLARANADYEQAHTTAQTHEAQGGTGIRGGILPGGDQR